MLMRYRLTTIQEAAQVTVGLVTGHGTLSGETHQLIKEKVIKVYSGNSE